VAGLPEHAGVKRLLGDLNRIYRSERALHSLDFSPAGFEWVDIGNSEMSIIAFLRKSSGDAASLLVVCNFTPVPRSNFLVGVPARGIWREILNTDSREYGGSGWGNFGAVESAPVSAHGRLESVNLSLPPLATLVLRCESHGDAA
jgi:1,4-alpha-glucan branching enzyme